MSKPPQQEINYSGVYAPAWGTADPLNTISNQGSPINSIMSALGQSDPLGRMPGKLGPSFDSWVKQYFGFDTNSMDPQAKQQLMGLWMDMQARNIPQKPVYPDIGVSHRRG